MSYTLTKKQYQNTLNDLFGSNILSKAESLLALIPSESYNLYDRERLNGISKESILAYHRVAKNIADQVTADNNLITQFFGTCATQSSPGSTCINTYLNSYARRIFRRPLNSTELTYARNLVNGGGSYKTNINHLLAYHLQSPYFIMRVELGSQNDETQNFEITPYELASRLAFAATDSAPDEQLLNRAADGTILNLSTMRSEAKRLLLKANGRSKLKDVLMGWSSMNHPEDISILPDTLLSQYYGANLETAMVDEAEKFIEYILYEKNGTFQDLLTSKASFASNPDLAKIYQHAPASSTRTPGSATALMSGRRQGLLLRAPALTSAVPRASSIERGVNFQANILCNELPSPTGSIFDSRFDQDLTEIQKLEATTRDSVHHLTNDSTCMTCHSSINPAGFAFENFGPFGELRTQEKIFKNNGAFYQNLPINSSATVPTFNNQSVAVQDAMDLVNYVANSNNGKACFSKKMFRFIYEKRETADDNCQLDQMYQSVSQEGGTLVDAFVKIIANEPSKWKRK